MKRIRILLLACTLLLACVPTPDHEIIENKGDKKDWQVDAQPVSDTVLLPVDPETAAVEDYERQDGPLYERLNAPKLWNTENNEFGFPIMAKDCPVYLPDVSAVPAVEAERRDFTQADIDAVAAAMFPPETVWYPCVARTKEEIAAYMQEVMEEAAEDDGSRAQYYEDKLNFHKKLYDNAPSEADIKPITTEITTCQDGWDGDWNPNTYHGVDLETRVAGEHWTLKARVDGPVFTYIEATRCADLWMDQEPPLDAPYGVNMTRNEAIRKATEFAQKLSDNEYSVCFCAPMFAHSVQQDGTVFLPDRYSQWGVVLMRTFNGFPSAYAAEEVGADMDSTVTAPVQYERMELHIDDKGVSYMRWNTPMRVTGVVQSDAQLISFDEAADRAMQHIAAHWKYTVENDRKNGKELTVFITRVTLGLWRIAKKNGGWYYVPVYHFFSDGQPGSWHDLVHDNPYWNGATYREAFLRALQSDDGLPSASGLCRVFSGEYWGGITVNALDGTIIDKDKGY